MADNAKTNVDLTVISGKLNQDRLAQSSQDISAWAFADDASPEGIPHEYKLMKALEVISKPTKASAKAKTQEEVRYLNYLVCSTIDGEVKNIILDNAKVELFKDCFEDDGTLDDSVSLEGTTYSYTVSYEMDGDKPKEKGGYPVKRVTKVKVIK